MKVMIVDDVQTTRVAIARVLERQGHQIMQAGGYTETLQRIGQFNPDLIMLDWLLPDGDGLGLFRALEQSSALHKTAKVMMTAIREPDRLKTAKDMGVDGLVSKPVQLSDLNQRIHEWVFDRAAKHAYELPHIDKTHRFADST